MKMTIEQTLQPAPKHKPAGRRRTAIALLLCLTFSAIAPVSSHAENASKSGSQKLPVKRVVLYKNGVGYFEHLGQVHDSQDLSIDFNTAQLNDVLKSLTLLDLNGGAIGSVRYNSLAPLEEQLKSVHLPAGESPTLAAFLGAIRGARVEVHSGPEIATGRVLSVEEKQQRRDGAIITEGQLSIVTDTDEIKTFALNTATSVRMADADLQKELNRYLGLLDSVRDQDLRRMTVSTIGTGDRNIFVSYISEVPVWKSTYRILLPSDTSSKPMLQGWAIVDNTVAEDWKDVELSLVSGAPQSFIQDLSTPLYTRRPVVPLPETAMLTPQTHEGTMEEAEKKTAESLPAPPAPPSGATNDSSFNITAQNGQVELNGFTWGAAKRQLPAKSASAAFQAQVAQATSKDLGDLFEYDLKEKVTIAKNQSALVPIIHANIDAEKVTIWNSQSPQPLRALWIKNTSGIDLDAGAFNIIDKDAFAGEGMFDVIKPDERRLISYALDQGIRVDDKSTSDDLPVTHVVIANGSLILTNEERAHAKYLIRNSNSDERDVVVEYPSQEGWQILGDVKPEETTQSYDRFRIKVQPKQTAELKFEISHPLDTTYALSDLTDDQLLVFVRAKSIKPDAELKLRSILRKKAEIASYDKQIESLQAKVESITKDQDRVRKNMEALKGSAEEKQLTARYTRQLNLQEDTLQRLNTEIENLTALKDKNQEALDEMIQNMSLNETIGSAQKR